jgi:DNA repair protein RadC
MGEVSALLTERAKTKCSRALVHSEGIFPSEEIEHSIGASSVIYAHIIPSGKHEPQRENL